MDIGIDIDIGVDGVDISIGVDLRIDTRINLDIDTGVAMDSWGRNSRERFILL